MKLQMRIVLVLALLAASLLAACRPSWSFMLELPDGKQEAIDYEIFDELGAFTEEDGGKLPLERVLAESGYHLVDKVLISDEQGQIHDFDWRASAAAAWLLKDGRIEMQTQEIRPQLIRVETLPEIDQVEASIMDITPTVVSALGLPEPELANGRSLSDLEADSVLLLFLDGFGYLRYQAALEEGSIPYIASLAPPLLALTIYPPVTVTSSAALLSGAPPVVNGVRARGTRTTDAETLFDVAASAGLRVVAVEGEALAFNLRNAEIDLSGDRDGNGSTDDNVLANALAVLSEGMPDLFFVHFHGIDDAGHTYGPGAPQEVAAVAGVDAAVARLVDQVPAGTLVIIFADHGMHREITPGVSDYESGNHGNLIAEDMLIPIFIYQK